jgi:hypothetical protein
LLALSFIATLFHKKFCALCVSSSSSSSSGSGQLICEIFTVVCGRVVAGLLSERQCIARNARRQTRQKIFKPRVPRHRLGTTSVKSQLMSTVLSVAGPPTPAPATNCSDDRMSPACHTPLDRLSDEHKELVSRIVAYQDKYELPTPDDVARVSVSMASRCVCCRCDDEDGDLVGNRVIEFRELTPIGVAQFQTGLARFTDMAV